MLQRTKTELSHEHSQSYACSRHHLPPSVFLGLISGLAAVFPPLAHRCISLLEGCATCVDRGLTRHTVYQKLMPAPSSGPPSRTDQG